MLLKSVKDSITSQMGKCMARARACGRFIASQAIGSSYGLAPTCHLAFPPVRHCRNGDVEFVPSADFHSTLGGHAGGFTLACPSNEVALTLIENRREDLLSAAKVGLTESFVDKKRFWPMVSARIARCAKANAIFGRRKVALGASSTTATMRSRTGIHAFAIFEPPAPAAFELHIFMPGDQEEYPGWLNEGEIFSGLRTCALNAGCQEASEEMETLYSWAESRSAGVPGLMAASAHEYARYLRGFSNLARDAFFGANKKEFLRHLPEASVSLIGLMLRVPEESSFRWSVDAANCVGAGCLDAVPPLSTFAEPLASQFMQHEHRHLVQEI